MPDLLHKDGILYFNVKNQYNSVLFLSTSEWILLLIYKSQSIKSKSYRH